jgi:hypothetical protein
VSIPRIEPGRKDNVVLMYWGNPLAARASSGPSVFGSLTCALHMGPATDGSASHLQDSSGHESTGIVQNRPSMSPLSQAQPEGIAGPALAFYANGTYLAMATQKMGPQPLTVSLWLKTTSSAPAGVAGFLESSAGSDRRFDHAIRIAERGQLMFGVLRTSTIPVTVSSLTGYNDGDWHHVVGRFGSAGQYLFVDGEPIADNPTRSGAVSYLGSWCFGGDFSIAPPPTTPDTPVPPGSYFAGMLDEIQIVEGEPSDAWIRLSYATQRPDASAVSYARLP